MAWISHSELQDLLGSGSAEALCRNFGGVRYYIPSEPNPSHPFAPVLGLQGMRLLCRAYGGEKITVPNWKRPAPKKMEIIARLEQGETPRNIAIALDVTERWVWSVAEVHRPRERQLSLLEDA